MRNVSALETRRAMWAMVGILLLAACFYLSNLNAISFWEDESWLAIAIADGLGDVWTFATERGVHPPLYFYVAHFAKPLIGDGELALRWLGGLIALIGVAFTYRLGADLCNRRTGVFAALLVSGSIFLIYLTRLARQYTLFYTLSVMVIWVYYRWRTHPQPMRWWWALVLLQAAALYTHYFSIFLAMTVGLHALLTLHWGKSWRVAAALGVSGILFLPWLPSIFVQINSDLGTGLYYGVPDVPRVLENYIGRVGNANNWLFGSFTLIGLMTLLLHRKWQILLLLFIWIVGTFIPILIVNETLFLWYIGRNLLYTLPAVVLLYGAGLAYVSRSRIGTIVAISAAFAFIGFGAVVYEAFWPGTPDWRGAMQLLARDARPDDTFVIDGERFSTDYYLRRYLDARVRFHDMESWTANPIISERIWLIDSGQAVNLEAIDALPDEMLLTRRLVRLPIVAEFYQMPPQSPQVVYGMQMALGYTGEARITLQAGEVLHLDVWWQALRPPDFNYSASFQIWDEAQVIAQTDGNFNSGRLDARVLPVGVWTPDTRRLRLPPDLPAGEYMLKVTVYDWRDGSRLAADSASPDHLYTLLTIVVV